MSDSLTDRLSVVVHEKFGGKWARLAECCGLPRSSMQTIKRGSAPNWNTISRICAGASISADWLMTGLGSRYRTVSSSDFDVGSSTAVTCKFPSYAPLENLVAECRHRNSECWQDGHFFVVRARIEFIDCDTEMECNVIEIRDGLIFLRCETNDWLKNSYLLSEFVTQVESLDRISETRAWLHVNKCPSGTANEFHGASSYP